MITVKQIRAARSNGILRPVLTARAATVAGIPYYVACAFLEQESGGGANVYGHDVDVVGYPRPFWGHGEVTEENYEAYKRERDLGIREDRFSELGRRSQGVGPMQLTFYGFQDEADAAGGCWDPYTNMLVAFRLIRRYYLQAGGAETTRWWTVARRYNGKESYADQMASRFRKWKGLVGE